MNLVNQPHNGSLGSLLISNLNENFNSFKFIVAYAKLSGVRHLEAPINSFKSNGGQIIGTVGIDQHNTSLEAIERLMHICDELYIYHSEVPTQTFHPKVYVFESLNNIWFSSGSSNLTSGGLFTNYETNIYDELQLNDYSSFQIYADIQDLFNIYTDSHNDCCFRVTPELISTLFAGGYIYPEQTLNRNGLTREHTSNPHERVFGSENFNAPTVIPSLFEPHPNDEGYIYSEQTLNCDSLTREHTSNPHERIFDSEAFTDPSIESSTISSSSNSSSHIVEENNINDYSIYPSPSLNIPQHSIESFWFEMRKSTGGSRNILDLSSTAKLRFGSALGTKYITGDPDTIYGGIYFFDIDAHEHNTIKNITISYGGNDYFPSTILYASDNQSWRIQLKGDSITDDKPLSQYGVSDFVDNILIFHKISSDNYILEVVDSSELDNLMQSSIFYATNGRPKTSKAFGKLK